MFVYVFNKKGKPLMPCKPAIARLLLKEGKAKCVRRTPFTVINAVHKTKKLKKYLIYQNLEDETLKATVVKRKIIIRNKLNKVLVVKNFNTDIDADHVLLMPNAYLKILSDNPVEIDVSVTERFDAVIPRTLAKVRHFSHED